MCYLKNLSVVGIPIQDPAYVPDTGHDGCYTTGTGAHESTEANGMTYYIYLNAAHQNLSSIRYNVRLSSTCYMYFLEYM